MNKDFIIDDYLRLIKYEGNRKDVVIPDSVTDIGPGAFEKCDSLENVVVPDSVKTIDNSTF